MFQPWRFKLKEAEVALEQGRLEDAARMLKEGDLPTYLPAQQLLAQVAVKMGARAVLRARGGELEGAWRDLDAARNHVLQRWRRALVWNVQHVDAGPLLQ